jgi:hypothetical protein
MLFLLGPKGRVEPRFWLSGLPFSQVFCGLKDAWQQNVTEINRCLFRRVLDSGAVSFLGCRKKFDGKR